MAPVAAHPPPPKRLVPAKPPVDLSLPPSKETWGQWWKRKGTGWGTTAAVKGLAISDTVGGRVNGWAEHVGAERFWPTTGDGPQEMEKAARIIKAFTVDGVGAKIEKKDDKTGKKIQRRIQRKIPAKVFRQAKGLVVFSSLRNGIAPFGGAGGSGVILARLEDGSWSAPSFISPNNMTVGLMAGLDLFDCILVLRTQEAVDSFASHKVTIGSEIAVAAGPYGGGTSIEVGVDRQPVLSYIKTRGLYAGVELVGQAFLYRFDEAERVYFWPGIEQKDILSGRTRAPREAEVLFNAIDDAESGAAQKAHGEENEFEEWVGGWEDPAILDLQEGETLKLPPTPEQLERAEEDEEWRRKKEERDNARFLR
ncbi:hypothetical protein JCM3770_006474 [Rhodotorula araucariae]